jgi:hypothetical protein
MRPATKRALERHEANPQVWQATLELQAAAISDLVFYVTVRT